MASLFTASTPNSHRQRCSLLVLVAYCASCHGCAIIRLLFNCSAQVHTTGRGLLHSNAARGHLPSRLGCSQPGSPTAGHGTAGLLGTTGRGVPQLCGDSPCVGLQGIAGSNQPGTCVGAFTARRAPLTQLRQQQQQPPTAVSLGSNTSSTPEGLLISPGVAALASKYATSSAGTCSIPDTTDLPEQHSTGAMYQGRAC